MASWWRAATCSRPTRTLRQDWEPGMTMPARAEVRLPPPDAQPRRIELTRVRVRFGKEDRAHQ